MEAVPRHCLMFQGRGGGGAGPGTGAGLVQVLTDAVPPHGAQQPWLRQPSCSVRPFWLQSAFGSAAEALESAHSEVLAAIRERYSAETLWSDKIRRASTWWTAGLMGLHLASFLVGAC